MATRLRACLPTLCLSLLAPSLAAQAQQKPWPIRAVIVTTFEIGEDTGDAPGEFQHWVEREHLTEIVPFPGGVHPLRTNPQHTLLGMVGGEALVNATTSMMALGLDPRFDLTHAYFLINGIAGIDPEIGSLGSAAWARYVINDVAREIDPREAPAEWPYGLLPMNARTPNPATLSQSHGHRNAYPLNPGLVAWAFVQTRDLKLPDDAKMAGFRATYTGFPNAQRPPFVLLGESFASDIFWHGRIMTQYARDWVRLYTEGKGVFAMTDMEDSGFLNALTRLGEMHRVDAQRVLVLRTASNFSEQPPGQTALESAAAPHAGTQEALESAWLCGSTVLHALLAHWETTYTQIPGN